MAHPLWFPKRKSFCSIRHSIWIKALSSRKNRTRRDAALIASYLTVALIHYDLHVLSWIFYFQMMLLGGLLAGKVKEMGRHGHRHLLVLTLTMLIYVGLKLGMTTGRIPGRTSRSCTY